MRVLIAGDYCERYRVADVVASGNYGALFDEELLAIINKADYSIVNFEFPVVVGNKTPIEKCGPNIKGSQKSIEAIKYAGFKCASLANNHVLDYGSEALLETKSMLEEHGIDTVGAGKDLIEASKVLYRTISGKTLAIINCCEHEFSIAKESKPGANPLNPIHQYYSILEARKHADYVLVIVHGGHEHWQLPSPRMVETYRFFIDCGADAVVNHHQHCYSGYEIFNNKPIFYGLGNFCFDSSVLSGDLRWGRGYMVELTLERGNTSFRIIPYEQCNSKLGISLLVDGSFDAEIQKLNKIISSPTALQEETESFYISSHMDINMVLSPISNRFVQALQYRGILPKYKYSKKHLLRLFDYLSCEAHGEKVLSYLESECFKLK